MVIAIIAVLAGLLLPGLGRARQAGLGAACQSNLRQLQLAWLSYTHDHADVIPPNSYVYIVGETNGPSLASTSWAPGNVTQDTTTSNLVAGVLDFPDPAARGKIPQLDRAHDVGGRDGFRVGIVDEVDDHVVVASQREQFIAAGLVPEIAPLPSAKIRDEE